MAVVKKFAVTDPQMNAKPTIAPMKPAQLRLKAATKRALRSGIRAVVRQWPVYSGVMRLVNSRLLKGLTSEHEVVTAKLRCGAKIVVDVADYCGRPIYYWGDYDARITSLCVGSLRPGDVMLDIGANYGEVALAAAARVGPSGAVHAFEPNATIARYLRRSTEINGFQNVFVHEVALGARDETAELTAPEDNTGAASLMSVEETESALLKADVRIALGTVQVRDTEDYVESLHLRSLAVVKLDVEGMEAVVIAGLEQCLAKYRPRLIAFESHESGKPFFERRSVELLGRLGYRFAQVDIRRTVRAGCRILPIHDNQDVGHGYDFVATPAAA